MHEAKILVIINPVSGGRKKNKIVESLSALKNKGYNLTYVFTQYAGHAEELAEEHLKKGEYDIFGIAGGDGTINEVAQKFVNSEKCLWIIPSGSGNGLARSLGLPINTKEHFDKFPDFKITKIDAGKFNNRYFFTTAGIGIDAQVAYEFQKTKKRGYLNYVKITLKHLIKRNAIKFKVFFDEKSELEMCGLQFTICNANQYGNDFFISPNSLLNDGILEGVCLPKKSIFSTLKMLREINKKKIHLYKGVITTSFQYAEVNTDSTYAHVDGEPFILENKKSTFTVCKGALNVLK